MKSASANGIYTGKTEGGGTEIMLAWVGTTKNPFSRRPLNYKGGGIPACTHAVDKFYERKGAPEG